MTDEHTSIPVEPAADVGSERLAAALAERDIPAVGQALRHDYVVVPVTRDPSGASQIAVYGAGEPGAPVRYDLYVFSSASTFAAFVGDAPAREFALQTGSSLGPFLEQHRDVIGRVVFDPAGPHAVQAAVEDVLAVLEPQVTDDDVAWVAGAPETGGGDGGSGRATAAAGDAAAGRRGSAGAAGDRAVGLDLALSKDWAVIDLTDQATIERQAAQLVADQLKGLPPSPVLRAEMTRWLTSSGQVAAAGRGRFMAFFLRRNEEAAVALTVTMYWHELGPEIGGRSHLDAMTDRIRSRMAEGEELVGATSTAGPFVRHTRTTSGAKEVGGEGITLLVTDYWLLFPDRRGLCLLSFSSPHVELREQIQLLADNIVLAGSWVMESAAA
ncbi:hypothetical protein [Georgenia daeguensis]|uniref:Uncharacterized protein n=1 Tax=Georgenia daeguensis TaxID=908355 RepID=A0ABP8EVB2_9MICO